MIFAFESDLAERFGVEESIMLQNFIFWINKNIANNKHFHDGRYWTYNSNKGLKNLFPFWSDSQIRRILNSLIEKNVLITGNYNKSSYDRTLWYSVNESAINVGNLHLLKSTNGIDEIDKPIPDIKPDKNNNITSDAVVITDSDLQDIKNFEEWRSQQAGYKKDYETVTESKPQDKPIKSYAYCGHVIRLNDKDFKAWKKRYSNLDLEKELSGLDDYYYAHNVDDWFFRVQKELDKRNNHG